MKLQERIQNDLKPAMFAKDEDRKSLIRVIMSEMSRVGKELTDDEVIKILRKMKENAELMSNKVEISILEDYLPMTLNSTQTKNIIVDLINKNGFSGIKDMGKVMTSLKTMGGQIDGKLASQITKELLS